MEPDKNEGSDYQTRTEMAGGKGMQEKCEVPQQAHTFLMNLTLPDHSADTRSFFWKQYIREKSRVSKG